MFKQERENEVLREENKALNKKTRPGEMAEADVGGTISSLVAKTENLYEIVGKVKDEIISTVANLQRVMVTYLLLETT